MLLLFRPRGIPEKGNHLGMPGEERIVEAGHQFRSAGRQHREGFLQHVHIQAGGRFRARGGFPGLHLAASAVWVCMRPKSPLNRRLFTSRMILISSPIFPMPWMNGLGFPLLKADPDSIWDSGMSATSET